MSQITAFRADVYWTKPEEGGRRTPIFSGYRPPFDFGLKGPNGEKMVNGCVITLEGRERVEPGERCFAHVSPFYPELVQEALRPGATFDVTEGARVVGRGTIIELYRDEP